MTGKEIEAFKRKHLLDAPSGVMYVQIAKSELLTLVNELCEERKRFYEAMNQSAITDMTHSNIEWQRDWAQRMLARIYVGVPSPMDAGMPGADEYIKEQEAKIEKIRASLDAVAHNAQFYDKRSTQ